MSISLREDCDCEDIALMTLKLSTRCRDSRDWLRGLVVEVLGVFQAICQSFGADRAVEHFSQTDMDHALKEWHPTQIAGTSSPKTPKKPTFFSPFAPSGLSPDLILKFQLIVTSLHLWSSTNISDRN
ncbi:hypothetical protein AZE42_03749 [Rhizopogon vesiculosus]|uniref:Uncharacterized protein n=1 Tax=Rhizopogon vesiculosus TaxID=180088 RepID=A0A1J8QZZ6_9AGAM|nr:hypothetical protein AZE42_03749 [Rhizopogon vesiculosus]